MLELIVRPLSFAALMLGAVVAMGVCLPQQAGTGAGSQATPVAAPRAVPPRGNAAVEVVHVATRPAH